MPASLFTPAAEPLQTVLFEQNPLPYFILQRETLQVAKANNAAASFFGYTPTVLHAACFTELFITEDANGEHGLLKKLQSGAPFFLLCKTGAAAASVQVFQIPMPQNESFIAVMLVPVSGSETVYNEDLMADMVNESYDVLTACDLNFKPLTWSKTAEQLYGISRAQALGHSIRDYIDIQYNGTTAEAVRTTAFEEGYWRGEMHFIRPADSKKITLLITFKLIKSNRGTPLHYFVSGTDITDRKESEARLLESEDRFRELADTAPVGIWVSEVENNVVYINKPLADYTGVCPVAFNKTTWRRLVHPDDLHGVLNKFRDRFRKRLPVTLIYRLKHHSNNYRWVQDTGMPRFLSNGSFVGYIGSIVDINETKTREEQLQYQATLMNHVQDSIITTDLQFRVRSLNVIATELYGTTEAESVGKYLPHLAHFNYIGTTKEAARDELEKAGIWKGEIDIEVKGKWRNFLFTVTFVSNNNGQRIGVMAVGREITDRKEAEQKLQQSESFYRSLIADSIDGKLLTTTDGTITFASPALQTILGYEAIELEGRNAFEFVHPDDRANAQEAFQLEVTENSKVKFIETRILKQDGTWLWCLIRGHNLLHNPHVGRLVISLHDDSQRKLAADALRESEQRFRALIKDLKLGVLLENSAGQMLMYNKAAADLFCMDEAAFATADLYALFKKAIHENGRPFAKKDWPMQRAAHTKNAVPDTVIGIYSPRGERIWLLINSNPVLNDAGAIRHIITSVSDITERKKLTQRLLDERLNQQRLLTQATIDGQERERKEIGKELHDNIGQQLATTKLYLDLAKDTSLHDAAEMLGRASKSITDVINEVRTISHSLVPPTLRDLGLVESVHDLAESIGLLQNLHIEISHTTFYEEGLPENEKLMLYRIIQEALNNIIKHAQATGVHIHLARSSRAVSLEITDNGQGFDLDKVRKGLGLHNIRNRAELFGGTCSVKAAPGTGCTVRVVIPDSVGLPAF